MASASLGGTCSLSCSENLVRRAERRKSDPRGGRDQVVDRTEVARERVCAWRRRGRSGRGWAQLYRRARDAASLFALPRAVPSGGIRETARHVLAVLRALAPAPLSAAPGITHPSIPVSRSRHLLPVACVVDCYHFSDST